MNDARLHWFKFWPKDWYGDKGLRTCSLAARGLWIDLMCVAHEGQPYGHVTLNGEPLGARQIANIAGITEREAAKLLAELHRAAVFSTTEAGVIYSRRMVRDLGKRQRGKEDGKDGGNPDIIRGTVPKADRVRPFKRSDAPAKTDRIFAKSEGRCHWCRVPLQRERAGADFFQVDHVIAIRDGGTNAEENLVAACADCNHKRALHSSFPHNPTPTQQHSDTNPQEAETEAEKRSSSLRSGAVPPPAMLMDLPPDRPKPIRSLVYSDGIPIIRDLTGQSEAQARTLLGRLLRECQDDCARLHTALREAHDLKPADPVAWLFGAVKRRGGAGPPVERTAWIRDAMAREVAQSREANGTQHRPPVAVI